MLTQNDPTSKMKGGENIMNRKIALSAISIVGALSIMSGATFAAFTSDASNNGNTFGAGDMVLRINGQAGSGSTPVFGVAGAVPGNSYTQKLTLVNDGPTASFVKVVSIDLGGANTDLANKLTINFFNDIDDNGVFDPGEADLGSAHLNDAGWTNFTLPGVTISAGGTYRLGAKLTFDADADNTYKGKSMVFNLNFQEGQ